MSDQTAFRRAPRPLIGWLWVLTGVCSFAFRAALAMIVLRGLERWANGEHVDLGGLAAIAGIALPFIGQLIAQGIQWQRDRRIQIVEEVRAGAAPQPPFPSQPSSPPPDTEGPRPWQNRE